MWQGWIVALPALAVLYVINKRIKGKLNKGRDTVAVITMLVAVIVGCGLAFTFVGKLLAGFVSGCGHLLNSMTGENIGIAVPIALTLVWAGIAIADIAVDRQADKGAQWAAALMPTLLALVIGGTMGVSGSSAVSQVNTRVASFVTTNFGHK